MATVDKPRTRTSYVPPITPEELKRRNSAAMALLEEWAGDEADVQDQVETMAVLREALGENRIMSYRSAFKP